MFYNPFKKTIKPLKSSVLQTELNENEQENISGGATSKYLAGISFEEPKLALVTSPKDTNQ